MSPVLDRSESSSRLSPMGLHCLPMGRSWMLVHRDDWDLAPAPPSSGASAGGGQTSGFGFGAQLPSWSSGQQPWQNLSLAVDADTGKYFVRVWGDTHLEGLIKGGVDQLVRLCHKLFLRSSVCLGLLSLGSKAAAAPTGRMIEIKRPVRRFVSRNCRGLIMCDVENKIKKDEPQKGQEEKQDEKVPGDNQSPNEKQDGKDMEHEDKCNNDGNNSCVASTSDANPSASTSTANSNVHDPPVASTSKDATNAGTSDDAPSASTSDANPDTSVNASNSDSANKPMKKPPSMCIECTKALGESIKLHQQQQQQRMQQQRVLNLQGIPSYQQHSDDMKNEDDDDDEGMGPNPAEFLEQPGIEVKSEPYLPGEEAIKSEYVSGGEDEDDEDYYDEGEEEAEEEYDYYNDGAGYDQEQLGLFPQGSQQQRNMIKKDKKPLKGQDDPSKVHECEHCGKKYFYQGSLFRHLKVDHKVSSPWVPGGVRQRYKRFFCEFCGKAFEVKSLYLEHRTTHTGEKLYTCQECGKGFGFVSAYNYHVRSHMRARGLDKDEKQNPLYHYCERCGARFASPSMLRKHIRVRHEGEKTERTCEKCGLVCKNTDRLLEHVNLNHREDDRYKCQECGRRFGSKNMRDRHMLVHREPGLECRFCGKKVKKRESLESHERIHTGEAPFRCKFCPKTFRSRAALSLHKRGHQKKGHTEEQLQQQQDHQHQPQPPPEPQEHHHHHHQHPALPLPSQLPLHAPLGINALLRRPELQSPSTVSSTHDLMSPGVVSP